MSSHAWPAPQPTLLRGENIELRPLHLENDAATLFEISHGTPEKESVWKYLPIGPFASQREFETWLSQEFNERDPLMFCVWQRSNENSENERLVGTLSIMLVAPNHGRAEIGYVWMSREIQRTTVNTEAQFLVLRYLFDDLKYRRVEWKCNADNAASRAAAHRMGFRFEGRFAQHQMVKGRNRDTDWFALLDRDWPRCKANFETWLRNPGANSLRALNWD